MIIAEIESELKASKDEWEYKVYKLINDQEIPKGCVITYGGLAKRANKKYGLKLSPLNIGNLRRKLYYLLTHDTDIPLHRIASKGDARSLKDREITQEYNQRLRRAEDSWLNPIWLYE